jgi:hypothetical protein
MKKSICPLAFSLLLMLPSLLLAEPDKQDETPPWYEFEAIIFERIDKGAGSTELWPDDPGTPSLLNAIPYRALPTAKRRLGWIWRKLKSSRNYRPLYHMAWRQQIVDPERAQLIYISLPPENGGEVSPLNPPKLEGTLKIGVKRYLHLETDLLLRRPRSAEDTADPYNLRPPFVAYRMHVNRRMRSGKLQLLDHPVLGMLVQAEKYEPPKPDPLLEPVPVNPVTPDSASPATENIPAEQPTATPQR